jgi:hypothetical protein
VIPHWGLYQQFDDVEQDQATERPGPSVASLRVMLIISMVALAAAAVAHVLRYVLLLVNRSMLLHPLIAGAGVAIGLIASVLVLLAVGLTVVRLVGWLVARRAAAYARRGQEDPRGPTELWICCLLPGINLLYAPVFVLELASLEGRLTQLRRPIVVWWIIWVLSAVVAVWSVVGTVVVTFFATDSQHVADNTVITTVGYLLALAALLLAARVFFGFEGGAESHHVRRWVVVASSGSESSASAGRTEADDQPESPVPVESEGQDPAA